MLSKYLHKHQKEKEREVASNEKAGVFPGVRLAEAVY